MNSLHVHMNKSLREFLWSRMNDSIRFCCVELVDFLRRRLFLRKVSCPAARAIQQEFCFHKES